MKKCFSLIIDIIILVLLCVHISAHGQNRPVPPSPTTAPTAQEYRAAAVRATQERDSIQQDYDQLVIADRQIREALYNEIDISRRAERESERWKALYHGKGPAPYQYRAPYIAK